MAYIAGAAAVVFGSIGIGYIIKAKSGRYKVIERIGKGRFGVIEKVKHKESGRIYAMKTVPTAESGSHELAVLTKLQHNHIVHVFDFSYEKGKYTYLFMEFYPEGDLNRFLLKTDLGRTIDDVRANDRDLQFMKQMASGVEYLHGEGIIHRDLKLENILVRETEDGQYIVQISDFGISKVLKIPPPALTGDMLLSGELSKIYMTEDAGTVLYMAPEIIDKRPYNYKADIFSLGVICCAMLERETKPIEGKEHICAICPQTSPIGFALACSETAVRKLKDGIWINNYAHLDAKVRPLVNQMMERDYHNRPTANNVYEVLSSATEQPSQD